MELEFWGVRGTTPASGRHVVKYGGHTPCAAFRSSSGGLLVIDAGTGIKGLGERLMAVGMRHYGRIREKSLNWLSRVEIEPDRVPDCMKSGMTATVNPSARGRTTVRLTPSTVIDPFSTT